MLLERAGSKNARTMTYQCPRCSYTAEVPIGRPGDRSYAGQSRILCPRCPADDGSEAVDKAPFVSYKPK